MAHGRKVWSPDPGQNIEYSKRKRIFHHWAEPLIVSRVATSEGNNTAYGEEKEAWAAPTNIKAQVLVVSAQTGLSTIVKNKIMLAPRQYRVVKTALTTLTTSGPTDADNSTQYRWRTMQRPETISNNCTAVKSWKYSSTEMDERLSCQQHGTFKFVVSTRSEYRAVQLKVFSSIWMNFYIWDKRERQLQYGNVSVQYRPINHKRRLLTIKSFAFRVQFTVQYCTIIIVTRSTGICDGRLTKKRVITEERRTVHHRQKCIEGNM